MKALITGGTSGIGKEMALSLLKRGYEVRVVSRREGDFQERKKQYPDSSLTFSSYDLSKEEECYRLLKDTENTEFDIFINNAGYGDIGYRDKTDLSKEVQRLKVNDIATLILVKSFLLRFRKKNKGRVRRTASAAAFGVAPYRNVYYASKAFVYSLAHGYYRELKDRKSKVTLSVLCPGPVKTNFEKVANAKFTIHSLTAPYVGEYAIRKRLKGKLEIVPGRTIKLGHFVSHLVPKKRISKVLRKQSEIKD